MVNCIIPFRQSRLESAYHSQSRKRCTYYALRQKRETGPCCTRRCRDIDGQFLVTNDTAGGALACEVDQSSWSIQTVCERLSNSKLHDVQPLQCLRYWSHLNRTHASISSISRPCESIVWRQLKDKISYMPNDCNIMTVPSAVCGYRHQKFILV